MTGAFFLYATDGAIACGLGGSSPDTARNLVAVASNPRTSVLPLDADVGHSAQPNSHEHMMPDRLGDFRTNSSIKRLGMKHIVVS